MKFKSPFLLVPLFVVASCSAPAGGSSHLPSSQVPSSEVPSSESPSSEAPSSSSRTEIVVQEREVQYLDDFYRSYYQIFPYSFADGNGDGVGDIRGIIDKFDYIKKLGVTGIWINPISQAVSYHKYDVTNYKSIDTQFGTVSDYDQLVSLCHQNHISIIHDLVINHSSDQHTWFKQCMQAHKNNDTSNKYYNYYNVQTGPGPGCVYSDTYGLYYEAQFDRSMPDLNLQGVLDGTNTNLINDIKDIFRYWLIDRNIDGFRLDACTSFFTGDLNKNIEFLNWIKAETTAIKENCYIIGEVLSDSTVYTQYYNSNADSFFAFDDSSKYRNGVFMGITRSDVTDVSYFINNDIRRAKGHIPAPVLANHDIGRSTKAVPNQNRLQQAIFSIAHGTTYQYYGDEMGAKTLSLSGDHSDMGYRLPIQWGDRYTCNPLRQFDFDEIYPYGTVATQENDPNSLLNYVRKAFKYRLENPELARGGCEVYYQSEDYASGILKREYNGSVVYVALNLSQRKTATLDISELNVNVVGDLSVMDTPYFENGKLVMPPYSMLLLH